MNPEYLKTPTLHVTITAGSTIYEACNDIIKLSQRFGLCISTKFNGVILLAFPNSDAKKMAEQYHLTVASPNMIKMVSGI